MQFIWHSGWDCHILALRSSYNFDLTSGLADPCKIVNSLLPGFIIRQGNLSSSYIEGIPQENEQGQKAQ